MSVWISEADVTEGRVNMKRIYITGIAGMLGANIAYLLKDQYDITGVDKVPFTADQIKCEQFDLLDHARLKESILQADPDYLIHTAALIHVDLCEEEAVLAHQLNCELTAFLAKVCEDISCKMVYISTDAVFDGEEEKLYTEQDNTHPLNQYGKTKLLGEEEVLKRKHLVVRTNIYGFNVQDKSSFGEWIYRSLQNGESLNMFTDIDFSPVLVNDLTEVIMRLFERDLHGLYHVCATGAVSKYEFGKYMQYVFSLPEGQIHKSVSDDFPFKAKRSKHMGMSNKKVREELEIHIPTPKESIEKFFKLFEDGYDQKLKNWGAVGSENRR